MKHRNCNDSIQLSLGTAEQTIARNAFLIIKTHKQSCKELLAYCDHIQLTPETIEFLKALEKQTICAIEKDLKRIDFVYYRYNKCLYHFIKIIQVRVARKLIKHQKLRGFRNAKADNILISNIVTFQASLANHCSYLY